MFGKCNQIYWVCPVSPITSLNSGVWIIVPLGGWGAPKPQTVMRRNKNIHIPKCVSMVYDDFFFLRPNRRPATPTVLDHMRRLWLYLQSWPVLRTFWSILGRLHEKMTVFMSFQLLKTINHFINYITKRVTFGLLLIPPSPLSSLTTMSFWTYWSHTELQRSLGGTGKCSQSCKRPLYRFLHYNTEMWSSLWEADRDAGGQTSFSS